jgi:3,8-divinyl chlorophyllide a/chlorophyllide a reductase subunit Y
MTGEVAYDAAADVPVLTGTALGGRDLAGGDGMGCHAGAATMASAARAAGKSDILDQYARDYPQGPHDKPQSMCPAFGSLCCQGRPAVSMG